MPEARATGRARFANRPAVRANERAREPLPLEGRGQADDHTEAKSKR